MNEWIMVGIGLILTVGTGMFVASEFALVNLDRNDLETRQARGEKRLGPTIRALKITSTHLSGAQLGITLTTLLTGYTFEPAVSSMLEAPLTGLGVPEAIVPAIGTVIGILLATLFSMVIGELVPKNFALALPLATAKLVIPFMTLFTTVFSRSSSGSTTPPTRSSAASASNRRKSSREPARPKNSGRSCAGRRWRASSTPTTPPCSTAPCVSASTRPKT